MKIILVVSAFPKTSETFIVDKVLGLLDRGHNVVVVCALSDKREWARFPRLGEHRGIRGHVKITWPRRPRWLAGLLAVPVLIYCVLNNPGGTASYLYKGWQRWRSLVFRQLYLDAELVALRPDVIHFEFGALARERMYLRELLCSRVTVSFRGYDLNFCGLEDLHYYDEVWSQAHGVHCLGRDLWSRARQRGCPPNKLHVLIPPAVDAGFFSPESPRSYDLVGTEKRRLRILSVARLDWRKGYEFSMKAMRILRDAGVALEYRIVGAGGYLECLAFCRHQLELEDCVTFLGALSREEIKREMNWADLFLHGSVSEGFSNAVMEAQAMKLPIVCTDAGGLPENVRDGITGFVVPRRDPHELAEKLLLLAKDPTLRLQMGEAGRGRVMAMFRPEWQVTAFDEFYRSVVNGSLH